MYRLITLGNIKQIAGILSLTLLLSSCDTGNQPVLPTQSYDFEIVPDDEADKIADIAKKTMELQNIRANRLKEQDGQKLRGVHPKSHGCVVGNFVINKDINPNLQVGLFSKPGKQYKALIRYSNAAVSLAPDLKDGENGSRGMAIKVFDVDGKVLVNDKGANNQDFLMINTPAFAFPNVQSYKRLTDGLLNDPKSEGINPGSAFVPTGLSPEDLINLQKTGAVIKEIKSKTVRNPLEVQYFAAAPSSFGNDRVMKFSAEPCGGEKDQPAFTPEEKSKLSENYLHEVLASTMSKKENVCLDVKIQVLSIDQVKADREKSDVSGDIIEDATREWDQSEFPFISVAKITLIAPQLVDLSDATQQNCKSQSFNPWHSLTEHQPLGGINRLRKPVYINSADNRLNKKYKK